MILYLDTSALVKLYVDEPGSTVVRNATGDSEVTGTCELAYVELRAALARRHREGDVPAAAYQQILRDVQTDFAALFLIVANGQLVREAGDVAERYRLRAYDALHLTSALTLQAQTREAVTFACWDKTLRSAAAAAKLKTLAPG